MTAQVHQPDDSSEVAGLFLQHLVVLDALGRGQFAHAYREVTACVAPGTEPASAPEVMWFLLDLAEAAHRGGHRDAAAAHAAAIGKEDSHDLIARSPRLVLHARAAAALVANGPTADDLFQQAVRTPGAAAYPFDLARVHLLYGEHLRRAFAARRAREELLVARQIFSDLGAGPWLERTEAELRAVTPDRGGSRTSELTPQEREIALLAAAGMSNKEIAQQRHLSPRTVGAHLYRAFPKLGITSRAALRDALSSLEGSASGRREAGS
jgi:DNA-binding CsgD family transcriptional regulator